MNSTIITIKIHSINYIRKSTRSLCISLHTQKYKPLKPITISAIVYEKSAKVFHLLDTQSIQLRYFLLCLASDIYLTCSILWNKLVKKYLTRHTTTQPVLPLKSNEIKLLNKIFLLINLE